MPWRRSHYLISMKKLDTRIRDKAIAIADSLLKDGHDESKAVAIGIAQAKKWAEFQDRNTLDQQSFLNTWY